MIQIFKMFVDNEPLYLKFSLNENYPKITV